MRVINIKYFYIEDTGSCLVQEKYLDEFLKKHPEIVVERINAQIATELANIFKIEGVPTFVFLQGDKELARTDGVYSAENLFALVQELVSGKLE